MCDLQSFFLLKIQKMFKKLHNSLIVIIDTLAIFLDYMFTMNNEQINCAYLESLAFCDLVKLADEYGVDVPEDLDRRFLIAELLELAEEESNSNETQMVITGNDEDDEENVTLPQNYNETQIVGILRNPAWLFVFWNISTFDETKIKLNKGSSLKLRVCSFNSKEDDAPFDSFEVLLNDDSQEQYILLPKGINFVRVELINSKSSTSSDILAISPFIHIPKTSAWIQELNFGKENNFSPVIQLSGINDVLLEHYKEHRHSFM